MLKSLELNEEILLAIEAASLNDPVFESRDLRLKAESVFVILGELL